MLATDRDTDRDPVDECERDLDREELELFRRGCELELDRENICRLSLPLPLTPSEPSLLLRRPCRPPPRLRPRSNSSSLELLNDADAESLELLPRR